MNKYLERVEACPFCSSKKFKLAESYSFSEIKDWATLKTLEGMDLTAAQFLFMRCIACKLEFMTPRWNEEGMKTFYKLWYENQREDSYIYRTENKRHKELLNYFHSLSGNINRILDVGCGVGAFLDTCNETRKDWHLFGIEMEQSAALVATSKGYTIFNQDIMEFTGKEEKFDLITFNSVIEHLREPFKVVEKARTLLNHGGILYFNVPFAGSITSAFQHLIGKKATDYILEHVFYFRPNHFPGSTVLMGNIWKAEKPIYRLAKIQRGLEMVFPNLKSNISVIYRS